MSEATEQTQNQNAQQQRNGSGVDRPSMLCLAKHNRRAKYSSLFLHPSFFLFSMQVEHEGNLMKETCKTYYVISLLFFLYTTLSNPTARLCLKSKLLCCVCKHVKLHGDIHRVGLRLLATGSANQSVGLKC